MAEKQNKNALKHGAFAETLILPGEDVKDFEDLHGSLVDEWNPEGPSENDKVMSVAKNMWRKDRLRRHLQNKLTKLKKDDEMERKFRAQEYDRLLKVLEEIESGVPNSITEQNLSEKLGKRYVEHIKKLAPRKNYESDSGWLAAVSDLIVRLLDAYLVTRSNTPSIGDVLSDEDLSEARAGIRGTT